MEKVRALQVILPAPAPMVQSTRSGLPAPWALVSAAMAATAANNSANRMAMGIRVQFYAVILGIDHKVRRPHHDAGPVESHRGAIADDLGAGVDVQLLGEDLRGLNG